MKPLELKITSLIAFAGDARSTYIEALRLVKKGQLDEAKKKLSEAQELFNQAHKAHFDILNSECDTFDFKANILLIHAEDQLSSAECFGIFAKEWINDIK